MMLKVGDRVRATANNAAAVIWDSELEHLRGLKAGDIITIIEPPEDAASVIHDCGVTRPVIWYDTGMPGNNKTNFTYPEDTEPLIPQCTCDTTQLTWRGCTCGAFQYEQKQKREM